MPNCMNFHPGLPLRRGNCCHPNRIAQVLRGSHSASPRAAGEVPGQACRIYNVRPFFYRGVFSHESLVVFLIVPSAPGIPKCRNARPNPATNPTPSTPFGVTVDASGKRAFVANVQSSNVSVIDLSTFTVTGTFPVGSFPYAIAQVADPDRLFVTNQHDNSVSVIDLSSGQTLRTVSVGDYPEGIMLHPDGRHVYVMS